MTSTMRVTFDTNTLEKGTRPERSVRDPLNPDYMRVHRAVVAGRIEGFFSETIITIEGIQKADRAAVLGGTTLTQSEQITEDPAGGVTIVDVTLMADQPLRAPLHPEVVARIKAARGFGMRLLRAPRIGGMLINDPDGTVFAAETDEAATSKRLDLYHAVLRDLDSRGVGFTQVEQLANFYSARAGVREPWFRGLRRAVGVPEEKAVIRAVAEWADGDSVAAHIGYGLDYFCTGDEGKSSASASGLNAANRAWLSATYGAKFITMTELANLV